MADGRCFTVHTASKLYDNYTMNQNKIPYEDNYAYRQMLQKTDPSKLFPQEPVAANGCVKCDTPLLKVPSIY
jgi:hypothetical protein